MPHPSFDLDGDGYVSLKDLFLAKQFDKDKDGRLNSQERQAAESALKEGYDKKFMFGLDRMGTGMMSFRDSNPYNSINDKNQLNH